jgi:hypothetical protein
MLFVYLVSVQTMLPDLNENRLMSNECDSKNITDQVMVYQIRFKGHLGAQWTDWFGGLTVTLEENGDTLLTGQVVDQAALYGLLKKVRDLGMQLLSVNLVEPGPATLSDNDQKKFFETGDKNESS